MGYLSLTIAYSIVLLAYGAAVLRWHFTGGFTPARITVLLALSFTHAFLALILDSTLGIVFGAGCVGVFALMLLDRGEELA